LKGEFGEAGDYEKNREENGRDEAKAKSSG
jgi:hypothetical protein